MKIEIWNTRAGIVSAFGLICTVMLTLMTLVLAANIESHYIWGWVPVTSGVLWLTMEAFRNANYTLEYDAAGVRAHSIAGWDVGWQEMRDIRIVDDILDRRLIIEVAPDQKPPASRGWFGGTYGQHRTRRLALYPVKKPPRPPQGAQRSKGPRSVSAVWRCQHLGLGLGGVVLLAMATLAMMLGQWGTDFGALLALAGLAGGALAATGLRGRRIIAVVDAHGVRQVGQQHWTLPWQSISSAQIVAGTLVVTASDDAASAASQIQDSFPVDDATESDDGKHDSAAGADETRPRAGRGLGLVKRLTSSARLRASLLDSDSTTAPVAARDSVDMQQTIDHYLTAWRQRPQLGSGPAPEAWPITPETTDSVIQDLHQPEIG